MSKPTYVYIITSPSGKQYIGITCNKPENRWKEHSYRADTIVGQAIKKYGDQMKYEVVSTHPTREEASLEEIRLIKKLNTKAPNGYNILAGGDGALPKNLTMEHCENLSKGRNNNISAEKYKNRIKRCVNREVKLRVEALELEREKHEKPVRELALDKNEYRSFTDVWAISTYKGYLERKEKNDLALAALHLEKQTLGLI